MVTIGLQHSLGLVGLSLVFAVFGGYLGLGLAARARSATGNKQKLLLASAAWALALGIWTMHFVGILAAHFPGAIRFSVLLTLVSFLICVLVVGLSAYMESRQQQGGVLTVISAVFMGAGIVSMHYVGMHAVDGSFMMNHDWRYAVAAALLAFAASYGALRLLETELSKRALALSSVAFGLAVSGMHYLAMAGMVLDTSMTMKPLFSDTISSDSLALGVAVLAFAVSALFLLSLVPDNLKPVSSTAQPAPDTAPPRQEQSRSGRTQDAGQSMASKPLHIPVESEGATKFVECSRVCIVQATTHYTLIYDGSKEYFSPWSISEAEQKLAPLGLMRVHRSYLVDVSKVHAIKKLGTEAAVEVGGPVPRTVPVSRAHYAELKARLGVFSKISKHQAASGPVSQFSS